MFDTFSFYFILLMIYSFIGWVMEVVGKLIEKHKFINRGFLIGPICPIYGWGCIMLILLLSKYKSSPILLFFMAIIICSILEYATSYIMEKLFNARWWDYSRRKFNLNGRICAETMIPFGILGIIVIYIINPFFTNLIIKIPSNILNILAIIILFIYITDNIISTFIMLGFRKTLKTLEKDGTEEITKKVKEVLLNRNYLYKRIIKAFPNLISSKERIKKLKNNIDRHITELSNDIKKEANNKFKNLKKSIKK